MLKPIKCEDCVYFDNEKDERPCCGCVDGVNYEEFDDKNEMEAKEE